MNDEDNGFMTPLAVDIDLVQGIMAEPDNHIVRQASDMWGYYAEEVALRRLIEIESDPLHYEVFAKTIPHEKGHLGFCISKLQAGRIGDECFMTKGHYHSDSGTAEIYLGIAGEGYMLLKTSKGDCVAERMRRGRIVYVPPHWGHRSINTGGEPLISFCVYPAESGHNYGDIAKEGFPKRIFIRDAQEVIE